MPNKIGDRGDGNIISMIRFFFHPLLDNIISFPTKIFFKNRKAQ